MRQVPAAAASQASSEAHHQCPAVSVQEMAGLLAADETWGPHFTTLIQQGTRQRRPSREAVAAAASEAILAADPELARVLSAPKQSPDQFSSAAAAAAASSARSSGSARHAVAAAGAAQLTQGAGAAPAAGPGSSTAATGRQSSAGSSHTGQPVPGRASAQRQRPSTTALNAAGRPSTEHDGTHVLQVPGSVAQTAPAQQQQPFSSVECQHEDGSQAQSVSFGEACPAGGQHAEADSNSPTATDSCAESAGTFGFQPTAALQQADLGPDVFAAWGRASSAEGPADSAAPTAVQGPQLPPGIAALGPAAATVPHQMGQGAANVKGSPARSKQPNSSSTAGLAPMSTKAPAAGASHAPALHRTVAKGAAAATSGSDDGSPTFLQQRAHHKQDRNCSLLQHHQRQPPLPPPRPTAAVTPPGSSSANSQQLQGLSGRSPGRKQRAGGAALQQPGAADPGAAVSVGQQQQQQRFDLPEYIAELGPGGAQEKTALQRYKDAALAAGSRDLGHTITGHGQMHAGLLLLAPAAEVKEVSQGLYPPLQQLQALVPSVCSSSLRQLPVADDRADPIPAHMLAQHSRHNTFCVEQLQCLSGLKHACSLYRLTGLKGKLMRLAEEAADKADRQGPGLRAWFVGALGVLQTLLDSDAMTWSYVDDQADTYKVNVMERVRLGQLLAVVYNRLSNSRPASGVITPPAWMAA